MPNSIESRLAALAAKQEADAKHAVEDRQVMLANDAANLHKLDEIGSWIRDASEVGRATARELHDAKQIQSVNQAANMATFACHHDRLAVIETRNARGDALKGAGVAIWSGVLAMGGIAIGIINYFWPHK